MHVAANTMYGAADKMCTAADKMHGVANKMHGAADMMREYGMVSRPESVTDPPPYVKKKFLLNEYLGIFMHFESIFLFF